LGTIVSYSEVIFLRKIFAKSRFPAQNFREKSVFLRKIFAESRCAL